MKKELDKKNQDILHMQMRLNKHEKKPKAIKNVINVRAH